MPIMDTGVTKKIKVEEEINSLSIRNEFSTFPGERNSFFVEICIFFFFFLTSDYRDESESSNLD